MLPRSPEASAVPAEPDYDDLLLCNCAECGREVAADTPANRRLLHALRGLLFGDALPVLVAGRHAGRPYCPACLAGTSDGRGNTGAHRVPRQAEKMV